MIKGADETPMKAKSSYHNPHLLKADGLTKIIKIQRAFRFIVNMKRQIVKETHNVNYLCYVLYSHELRIWLHQEITSELAMTTVT